MKTKAKPKKKTIKEMWELVGNVGVDSGQLVVCDPCYIDSEWKLNTEPSGHPALVLSAEGRKAFPQLNAWRSQWPFEWGSFDDTCPDLGMSINEARKKGLVSEVDLDPIRDFSYRGASDVSHLSGKGFGQLEFKLGHAGAGVAFSSGYGDGIYQVFCKRNADGRISEVRIMLDPSPAAKELMGLE